MENLREIKFRQWIPSKKMFHYWGRLEDGVFTGPVDKTFCYDSPDEQFTGLKDRNRKEIYDGDIINVRNWAIKNDDILFTGRVYWNGDTEHCWDVTNDNGGVDRYDLWSCVEVIGNIHQNPELLESNNE